MEDLKNISPLISHIKKEVPFKVPEKYFDELPQRINEKIKQGIKPKKAWVILLTAKPLLAAASVAIVAGLIWLVSNNIENSGSLTTNSEGITENVEMDVLGVEEELLIDFLADENNFVDDETKTTVEDDAVFDYLNDNIDYSSIEEAM